MKAWHRAWLFLFCLSWVSLAFAQQQPGSVRPNSVPPNSVPMTGQLQGSAPPAATDRRLVLDVVVKDKSGKAITGLEEKDFTVLDNGSPQKILSFQAVGVGSAAANARTADPPLKIILLVDEVNTNFSRVAYERDQIKKFLQQNDGVLAHPMSMAFFSDTGAELQNVTLRDGNALLQSFDQHETALRSVRRSQGFYGAVERLQLSLNTLQSLAAKEAQTPGRKMVVWISPGWPILSGPEIELTTKQQAGLFASVVSLSTALREARITLYNVNPEGAGAAVGVREFYYKEFLKPITVAKKVLPGNLALQVLSEQSGGEVFTPSNDIAGQLTRCVSDADAFYTLTLDAAPPDKPNEYHALTVKVAAPGLTARTREGYYEQP
jgi:VWFA-related protein